MCSNLMHPYLHNSSVYNLVPFTIWLYTLSISIVTIELKSNGEVKSAI